MNDTVPGFFFNHSFLAELPLDSTKLNEQIWSYSNMSDVSVTGSESELLEGSESAARRLKNDITKSKLEKSMISRSASFSVAASPLKRPRSRSHSTDPGEETTQTDTQENMDDGREEVFVPVKTRKKPKKRRTIIPQTQTGMAETQAPVAEALQKENQIPNDNPPKQPQKTNKKLDERQENIIPRNTNPPTSVSRIPRHLRRPEKRPSHITWPGSTQT